MEVFSVTSFFQKVNWVFDFRHLFLSIFRNPKEVSKNFFQNRIVTKMQRKRKKEQIFRDDNFFVYFGKKLKKFFF
jgi:Zn-finger domain-containing protein